MEIDKTDALLIIGVSLSLLGFIQPHFIYTGCVVIVSWAAIRWRHEKSQSKRLDDVSEIVAAHEQRLQKAEDDASGALTKVSAMLIGGRRG